jgi:hypothetical protein
MEEQSKGIPPGMARKSQLLQIRQQMLLEL